MRKLLILLWQYVICGRSVVEVIEAEYYSKCEGSYDDYWFELPSGDRAWRSIRHDIGLKPGDLIVISGKPFKGATLWWKDAKSNGGFAGPERSKGVVICAWYREKLLGDYDATEMYWKIIPAKRKP